MGDRGNIVIRADFPQDLGDREAVFLYGHWSGYELPETLRAALDTPQARGRWDDSSYLARIIFDQMIGDSQGGETGYGISSRLTDNEYDLLVLHDRRVHALKESIYESAGFTTLADCPSISFEDYVGVPERTWDNLGRDLGAQLRGMTDEE